MKFSKRSLAFIARKRKLKSENPPQLSNIRKKIKTILSANVSGFNELNPTQQLAVIVIMEIACTGKQRHRSGIGTNYSSTTLRKQLGRNYINIMRMFFEFATRSEYLNSSDYEENNCKSYLLKPELSSQLNDLIKSNPVLLRDENYRFKHSVLALDKNGFPKVSKIDIPYAVEINPDAINRCINRINEVFWQNPITDDNLKYVFIDDVDLSRFNVDRYKKLNQTRDDLNLLCWYSRYSPTKTSLSQRYSEVGSGRLCGCDFHLQHLSKNIRNVAFDGLGLYDYDFENCHYSILAYLCQLNSCDSLCINEYVTNKRVTREKLAKELNVTENVAKNILIRLIYGARPGSFKLKNMLGSDTDEKFRASKIVRGLVKEIGKVTRAIINEAKQNSDNGYIMNEMNKGLLAFHDGKRIKHNGKNDPKDSQILAHILQGYESKMLETIVINNPGKKFSLLIFDGWIGEYMEKEPLEQLILREIGIPMKISRDPIGISQTQLQKAA